MSTKCHQKMSTKCHPLCPRDVTFYVHEMSATRIGMETFRGQWHFVDTFYQNWWHFVDTFWGWLSVDIFGDISWTFLSTKCHLVGWLFVDTFEVTFRGHFWWHLVDIFVHEMSPTWVNFRGHIWVTSRGHFIFFKTKMHRWNRELFNSNRVGQVYACTLGCKCLGSLTCL